MPHYKKGKQTEQLEFSKVLELMEAKRKSLTLEQRAFFWLLYYGGMRKSELYERTVGDLQHLDEKVILDIPVRKKGSAATDPLEFPEWFPGMEDVCAWLEKARKRKPSTKLLERWDHQTRITKRVKVKWLFPNIHRSTALIIVKQILGSKYYPHFLRLNRITEINSDPGSNYIRVRSFTGIKSMRVIEENYSGRSKREQKAAIDFMAKQIKGKEGEETDGMG